LLAVLERQDDVVALHPPHGAVERARRPDGNRCRFCHDRSGEDGSRLEVRDVLYLSINHELTPRLHVEEAVVSQRLHLREEPVALNLDHFACHLYRIDLGLAFDLFGL
jgi:hypothetical protein